MAVTVPVDLRPPRRVPPHRGRAVDARPLPAPVPHHRQVPVAGVPHHVNHAGVREELEDAGSMPLGVQRLVAPDPLAPGPGMGGADQREKAPVGLLSAGEEAGPQLSAVHAEIGHPPEAPQVLETAVEVVRPLQWPVAPIVESPEVDPPRDGDLRMAIQDVAQQADAASVGSGQEQRLRRRLLRHQGP